MIIQGVCTTPLLEIERIEDQAVELQLPSRVITVFLKSVTNPKDRIGLSAFNTKYNNLHTPTTDKTSIQKCLTKIKPPKTGEAYTELYAALNTAAKNIAGANGRKAIIVLSDGQNEPYYTATGKPNPQTGHKKFPATSALQACIQKGVSVFAINFGSMNLRDRHLGKIAIKSGGLIFNARNEKSLAKIYSRIIELIVAEYRITYRATMEPADIKFLKVQFRKKDEQTATYFSSAVFGLPEKTFSIAASPSSINSFPFYFNENIG